MYYPFLRGKRYEFKSLLSLSDNILRSGKVIPIIEPVTNSSENLNYIKQLLYNKTELILIVNPLVGELVDGYETIKSTVLQLNQSLIWKHINNFAYQITRNFKVSEFKKFIKDFNDGSIYLIYHEELAREDIDTIISILMEHDIDPYHVFNINEINMRFVNNIKARLYTKKLIVLCDGFKKENSNREYANKSEFSKLVYDYSKEGFMGYSDYLTIGRSFVDGGGSPKVLAIHYTDIDSSGVIIRHFKSKEYEDFHSNKLTMFLESMEKMDHYLDNSIETQGARKLLDYYDRNEFPGLGQIKQFSMENHMERIYRIMLST